MLCSLTYVLYKYSLSLARSAWLRGFVLLAFTEPDNVGCCFLKNKTKYALLRPEALLEHREIKAKC